MLLLVLFFIICAIVLLWQANRQRKALGLPGGNIIFADTQSWVPVKESLYSVHHGLTGKPDYLVESGNKIIPVEVKSTRISQGPYDSHIYQLAAYCLLVQHTYDIRPEYGILHYPNRTFRIDYTFELESAIIDLLQEIHSQENRKDIHRSHEHPARCARCGFNYTCDQIIGI